MRIPVATYRLQLTPDFGFSHAMAILPYLRDLGITDLYASPIFQARKGSLHGYDIVDPNKLNSDLGPVQEFEALMEEVRDHEMGWIQDIVPNHMAFDGQNSMLMDVLENGRASPFFDFFDIDWNHPYENMKDKVLAPFLGNFYMDDQKVFYHTHALIFKLVREGKITGLRIDHIDGLYDPLTYLKRIRQELGDIHVSVEKILARDESLPESWPVQGTTGYDFLNYVNGIFCAREHEQKLTQTYGRFTGLHTPCSEVVTEKKRLIIGKYMAGDIESLAYLLKSVSSRDRHAADVTLYGLKRALVEVLTSFPVYRSYVSPDAFSELDRRHLRAAIERAKEANLGLLLELKFIERFLLLDFADHLTEDERKRWTHFVMRFQ